MSQSVRAVIMAFDDVFVHTRTVRRDAIVQAAAAYGIALEPMHVAQTLSRRTLTEVVHGLLSNEPAVQRDPTLVELIAMTAARATSTALPHGGMNSAHIDARARARCMQYVDAGARLMLRADSIRRDVSALLQLAALDALPIVAICSDDRLDGAQTELVAQRAWRTIDRRLTALGIPRAHRLAIEPTEALATIAGEYVYTAEVWQLSH